MGLFLIMCSLFAFAEAPTRADGACPTPALELHLRRSISNPVRSCQRRSVISAAAALQPLLLVSFLALFVLPLPLPALRYAANLSHLSLQRLVLPALYPLGSAGTRRIFPHQVYIAVDRSCRPSRGL